ncbi:hypothetical protein SpCBS45565_g00191 [Spizellomyces sp. 'palustris']|nr:hypothetical protein SpCBS45565_g00191 [Spizellomyces sp. 'palustris']
MAKQKKTAKIGPQPAASASPQLALTSPSNKSQPDPPLAPLTEFAQFRVLPITVRPLSVSDEHLPSFSHHAKTTTTSRSVMHFLFIRAHESKKPEPNLPNGRTIFVVNIPVDATERHFTRLFRRCGKIERVVWRDRHTEVQEPVLESGAQAHVVFVEEAALNRAMAMKSRKRVWSDELEEGNDVEADEQEGAPCKATSLPRPVGLAKWLKQHFASRPRLEDLQRAVDTSLVAFEDAEREARIAAEGRRNVPDEDGFVTVIRGRGRRNVNIDGHGASVTAARPEEIKKLKPKKKELVDFYRFQMRETKRNQLAELRRKFEEDKLRIASLKANRRFKPY